jgi:CBS domain-containing protein
MRVAEVMTRDVITVPVDATIAEAAELMKNHDIGFFCQSLPTTFWSEL